MSPLAFLQTFLEGLASFLSPCILPTLPVYLVYLSGGEEGDAPGKLGRRVVLTIAFVLGFTLLFMALGAGATALGSLLKAHETLLRRIGGAVLVVFGLHYMGALQIGFLNRDVHARMSGEGLRFFSAMLFGAAFSLGWSACTGPMLGAALLLAGQTQVLWKGMALLFFYAMGLGLPFLIVALLYEKLRGVLRFFKRHARAVSIASGVMLILFGLAMLFDVFGYYSALFVA